MCPTNVQNNAPNSGNKCPLPSTHMRRQRGSLPNSPELQLPQLSVDRLRRSILHGALLESGSVRVKMARGNGGSSALERGRRELRVGACRDAAAACERTELQWMKFRERSITYPASAGPRHGPQDPDRVGSVPEFTLPGQNYFTTCLGRHHLVRPGPKIHVVPRFEVHFKLIRQSVVTWWTHTSIILERKDFVAISKCCLST